MGLSPPHIGVSTCSSINFHTCSNFFHPLFHSLTQMDKASREDILPRGTLCVPVQKSNINFSQNMAWTPLFHWQQTQKQLCLHQVNFYCTCPKWCNRLYMYPAEECPLLLPLIIQYWAGSNPKEISLPTRELSPLEQAPGVCELVSKCHSFLVSLMECCPNIRFCFPDYSG